MRRSRLGFGFCCTLAAAAVWSVPPVRAGDAPVPYDRPPGKVTLPGFVPNRTPDFCATYGEGFVRLQGTDTCVKIGGHVRVDTTISPRSQLEWGPGGFDPAPYDGETMRSHVRVNGNFGRPD
jgi:Porin subfamily